jgi:MFS family permease
MPFAYRRFLLAVGLFGIGDFAHTLLILRAIEILEPAMGRPRASSMAIGLYALHNVAGAVTALLFGAAADRFGRVRTLGLSYLLGPLMLLALILLPASAAEAGVLPVVALLGVVFLLGGALLAAEETLESAAAAEMLPPDRRGMGFGTLAAVNSGGDLVSSAAVGALWQILGPRAAFGIALAPMMAGSLLLFRRGRRPGSTGRR